MDRGTQKGQIYQSASDWMKQNIPETYKKLRKAQMFKANNLVKNQRFVGGS